jgi:prepilin-type N-terminal cleavage/methylation domain-containing protein
VVAVSASPPSSDPAVDRGGGLRGGEGRRRRLAAPGARAPGAARRRGRSALRRRRRAAGFSLVELVVATALVALALALAARLLAETQRRYAAAAREQLDPDPAVALAMLRADAQSAAGAAGVFAPGHESPGPLELVGHPAGTVRWEIAGGDLVRSVLDPAGRPQGRLLLLRDAGYWGWSEERGLLTARVGYRRHRAPQLRAAGSARPERAPETVELATLTVAWRGGTRHQRW